MQTWSLFEDGELFLDAVEKPAEVPVPVVVPEPPPAPKFSERAAIAEQLLQPHTVILHKIGSKAVRVTPADAQAFATLVMYNQFGERVANPSLSENYAYSKSTPALETFEIGKSKGRIYFSLKQAIAPCLKDSAVFKHLASLGLNIVAAPSLANYVPRAWKKQQRESTPFHLPEVADTRALYDRIEEGTIIRCVEDSGPFKKNEEYIVGQKQVADDEHDVPGFVKLHKYYGGSRADTYPSNWNETQSMEGVFEPAQPDQVIYDPDKCIPAVYKQQFEQNLKRLDKAGWPLFGYTRYDAAQAAVMSSYFNGKPMRMGKTREAIAFMKLRNASKVAFFCPSANNLYNVVSEMKAMGLEQECRIVDNHKRLVGQQPWMEIVPYDWIKYKNDDFDGGLPPTNKACPHCGLTLERKTWVEPEGAPGSWMWTSEWGYLCRNPECTYLGMDLKDPKMAGPKHGAREKREARKARGLDPEKRDGAVWLEAATEPVTHHFSIPKTINKLRHRSSTDKRTGSGYVDYDRKVYARLLESSKDGKVKRKGRKSHGFIKVVKKDGQFAANPKTIKVRANFIENSWVPPRYRRLARRWKGGILDEIHCIKSPNSDRTLAALGLRLKTITGLTGTLMPNGPSDAFWPMLRMFGNDTVRFPYPKKAKFKRGEATGISAGVELFNEDFTNTMTIENNESGNQYKKRMPFLKNPIAFWQMLAPKMIRRSYDDPMVLESLKKAGLSLPKANHQIILAEPNVQQAALMYASMEEFRQNLEAYKNQLLAQGISNEKVYAINSSYVISQMTRMRQGATCPDYINFKIRETTPDAPPLYTGARGGGKMEHIFNITANRVLKGEKVLILSNFQVMQKLLAEELKQFKPILFDTGWNKDRRMEAFAAFDEDPSVGVFIAGPLAIGLGTDLAGGPDSKCRTCISTDLLWRPGEQLQAWSRIQKPAKEQFTVDIITVLLNHSIDLHIHNVFYGKIFAAEQALDRKVITQKEKSFDVMGFSEQVLADRTSMLAILDAAGASESYVMPYLDLFGYMEEHTA